jgi:hypothetical protein
MVQSSVARCRSSYAPATASFGSSATGWSVERVLGARRPVHRYAAGARSRHGPRRWAVRERRLRLQPGAPSVPKPPWFPGESRGILVRACRSKIPCFQRLRTESGLHVLLAMQKVEGSNPIRPLPRMRLYRASNSILTAPLDAVLGKGFPADYPLATQTPASGVGSKRLIEGAAEHFLEPLDRHAAISSTCW